jgi:RNA polymerase sigma factor (sigma-70 family)
LNPLGDQDALRALVPQVLAGLIRRGEAFDVAEDALQEALLEALRSWGERPPEDPAAWLATVAARRLIDARRRDAARRAREEHVDRDVTPPPSEEIGDDTLFLLFCCCHPDLPPAQQIALTLRAVGGLTTREIADAFFIPEATMAQRISRAKRTLRGQRFDQPGDLAVVLRVLYLIHTVGHAERIDLTRDAIRLTRQLTLATAEPEARGLLALLLLDDARARARIDADGRIVPLERQDRALWDTRQIAEGVRVLQSALAVQTDEHPPGRYQIQAAISALHADARRVEETDWAQVVTWYDALLELTDDPARLDPAAVLGRAVAIGHALGPKEGLRQVERVREVIGDRHRWHAVRGYLLELDGDHAAAAVAYAEAARRATVVTERDHLIRQAARTRATAASREAPNSERSAGCRTRHPGTTTFMHDSADPHAHAHGHAHAHDHHPPSARGPVLADIVPGLGLPSEPRGAVDVGCGAGDDVRWLHDAGFRAIGIDSNAEALRVAASRTPDDHDITWLEASATMIPLDDQSCALVTDRGCLHHLPTDERPAYASEVARILAVRGAWIIRDVVGHHHQVAELSTEGIAELAAGAALRVESCSIVDDPGGHSWLVAILRRDTEASRP